MTPAERNYPVHEQELLAVIHALHKWRMLLLGMKVNVMSDHHSLTYLLTQKTLSRRQARWLELLADYDVDFRYIKGANNSVADALSRKDSDDEGTISAVGVECVAAIAKSGLTLSSRVKAEILEAYQADKFYLGLTSALPLREGCRLTEGLLFIEDRLYIPEREGLRQGLIDEAHRRVGHLGLLKTLPELRRDFFWPRMTKEAEIFVRSCKTCQKIKTSTTSPLGKMLTPNLPRLPLTNLAIDFIGPLPKVNNYNMILTCTCRLSGFTRLIPTCQSDTAEKTASRFFTSWIGTFGAPASIISDQDNLWTTGFWKALMKLTGTEFHMTTAFHPQANGRSERTNKTVGQILRTFTSRRQGKWLDALAALKFAINGVLNVAIGKSPFELIFGRSSGMFSPDQPTDGPTSLEKWVELREQVWASARESLWTSRVQQAVHHNKRCREAPHLPPDSWVLLNSSDWRGKHTGGVNKLWEKFEGPYRVIRSFNHDQNLEIELPLGDKRHPVFHVLKVKPFVHRGDRRLEDLQK